MESLHKAPPGQPPLQLLGRRLWMFRLIAVIGLPLFFLLLLEGGLLVAGYGHSSHFLIPDENPGWVRTNLDFLKVFMGDSVDLQPLNFRISVAKPHDTIRVVVLGESAAQGIPAPAFGFASQLRVQLRARFPGKNIEVVNTGIAAVSSPIVRKVAHDLAVLEPDVFIVYMGNNDIVGPYGPGGTVLPTMPPRWVVRLSMFVRTTKTGQLLQNLLGTISARGRKHEKPKADMGTFVEQATPSGDPRLAAVGRNFAANLTDIIHTAHSAGSKVIVCTLASNLKDCAPLLSPLPADLSVSNIEIFRRAFDRGVVQWRLENDAAARKDLTIALRIAPGCAESHFLLGQLALRAGNIAEARQEFLEAIRLDALGFRPGPMLNGIIRDVAKRESGVELVDAAVLLGSDASSSIPPAGVELFVDHVHFTWTGSYQLGLALAERIAKLLPRPPTPTPEWLDSEACAAVLGYTPTAQAAVLSLTEVILQSSPFNNQLTHCEDLARLDRMLKSARASTSNPTARNAALRAVQAAETQDPGNTFLSEMEEHLAVSLGLADVALKAAGDRRQLLPDTPAMATDEALRLLQAVSPAEALALLEKTAASCPVEDLPKMGPVFAQYYITTKQVAPGLERIDKLFAYAPGQSPHLLRASLLKSAGDEPAAEQEYRSALTADPANQGALEGLVALLMESRRTLEAESASLTFTEKQPQNHWNNLRAAAIHRNRGQDAEVIRLFLASEKSGPVNTEIEMTLSLKLASAHRMEEAVQHLALARRLAQIEQNQNLIDAIEGVLSRLHN